MMGVGEAFGLDLEEPVEEGDRRRAVFRRHDAPAARFIVALGMLAVLLLPALGVVPCEDGLEAAVERRSQGDVRVLAPVDRQERIGDAIEVRQLPVERDEVDVGARAVQRVDEKTSRVGIDMRNAGDGREIAVGMAPAGKARYLAEAFGNHFERQKQGGNPVHLEDRGEAVGIHVGLPAFRPGEALGRAAGSVLLKPAPHRIRLLDAAIDARLDALRRERGISPHRNCLRPGNEAGAVNHA